MKPLKLILAFSLLFTASVTYAQAYKDSVRAQFDRYSNHLIKRETKAALNYTNPVIFKLISKKQLEQAIEMVYNNPMLEFTMEQPSITDIGDSRNIKGQNYVILMYGSYMNIRLKNTEDKPDPATVLAGFEENFGKENVRYDEATGNFRIYSVKKVIANSANLKKWTFAVVEENQIPMLEKFIPKELL